jgi:hypothetical protein
LERKLIFIYSELQKEGVPKIFLSITFSHGNGNNVNYTAMYSFSGAANISVSGSFDIEELILSCSGLLCRAARALKGRNAAYEMELKKIMGF